MTDRSAELTADSTRPDCTPDRHVCRWRGRGVAVSQLLAGYLAGGSIAVMAQQFGASGQTVGRILEAHGIERRRPGFGSVVPSSRHWHIRPVYWQLVRCAEVHVCEWADKADLVDEALRQHHAGRSVRAISEALSIARPVVTRMLDAHADRPACTPDRHTCEWADNGPLVTKILDRYIDGDRLEDLAVEHETTSATISRILAAHHVDRRTTTARVMPTLREWYLAPVHWVPRTCSPGQHECTWVSRADEVDRLIARYGEGMSMAALAAQSPFSHGTIARILDAHGVPRRSRSEQCKVLQHDPDQLAQRYREVKSLRRVASEFNVSREWLRQQLAGRKALAA